MGNLIDIESLKNIDEFLSKYKRVTRRRNVIIINGSATFGKNTFIEQMSKIVKTEHFSSIDKYKKIATEYFDYTESLKSEFRDFLSALKAISIKYLDMPYFDTRNRVIDFLHSNTTDAEILFLDIREPSEIEKIVETFGSDIVTTVLIDNPDKECVDSNESDANVYDFTYDWIIVNDGTIDDLRDKAKILYDNILPHFILTFEEVGGDENASNI